MWCAVFKKTVAKTALGLHNYTTFGELLQQATSMHEQDTPSPALKPLLQDHSDEPADCKQLAWRVIFAQAAGLGIIWFAVYLLANMPRELVNLAYTGIGVGVGLLMAAMLWCWWDTVLNFFDRFRTSADTEPWLPNLPLPKRRQRLIKATLLLVVCNTALLLVLIRLTGGLGHSPLDPLLPVIPVIAIILRQPRKTVMWALIFQITLITLASIHWAGHRWHVSHPSFLDWQGYEAYKEDQNYILAYAVVVFLSILLSLLEYVATHLSSSLLTSLRKLRTDCPAQEQLKAVEKGAKDWIRFLDWRMLPTKDLSLVHRPEIIGKQALILAAPYWNGERADDTSKFIARRIAFLTYASHWIDDHFDPHHDVSAGSHNRFQNWNPDEFIRHDARLQGLIAHMEKTVHRNNRAQVTRAVIRIIYGGLIQNADTEDRLRTLLDAYCGYISQTISPEIAQQYVCLLSSDYRMLPWLTTKVVIELFDSCSVTFDVDKAEFYNLLYGPILYYQDIREEILNEHFGSAFHPVSKMLPDEPAILHLLNEVCVPLMPSILGPGGLSEPRKAQLRELLTAYKPQLPPAVHNAYEKLIGERPPFARAVGA